MAFGCGSEVFTATESVYNFYMHLFISKMFHFYLYPQIDAVKKYIYTLTHITKFETNNEAQHF